MVGKTRVREEWAGLLAVDSRKKLDEKTRVIGCNFFNIMA